MRERLKAWWRAKIQEWKNEREIKRWEERIRRSVPYGCRDCEVLGICRDEQNGWKCRNGCLVISSDSSKR